MKFTVPDWTDKRLYYTAQKLSNDGFQQTESPETADFILLGVNPDKKFLSGHKLTFAGNVSTTLRDNLYDYTKSEAFAVYNAFLTAEAAVALAATYNDTSLINAKIMIVGYGRIGKALHRLLSVYTNSIIVCARNTAQRTMAEACGAKTESIDFLSRQLSQDFIFNTVAHPLFDYQTLSKMEDDTVLMDLASFPGGADTHAARVLKKQLTVAGGLPAKYAPKNAGYAVADAVEALLKEVCT